MILVMAGSRKWLWKKSRHLKTDAVLPMCLKGSRACPPEDVGGIGGYMMFLEAISNPVHPEYDSILEWITGEADDAFDPEHFILLK